MLLSPLKYQFECGLELFHSTQAKYTQLMKSQKEQKWRGNPTFNSARRALNGPLHKDCSIE